MERGGKWRDVRKWVRYHHKKATCGEVACGSRVHRPQSALSRSEMLRVSLPCRSHPLLDTEENTFAVQTRVIFCRGQVEEV